MSLLLKNADVVLTMDAARRELRGGWVHLVDGAVAALGGAGDAMPAASESIDLTGHALDAPFPELTADGVGGSSRRYAIAGLARAENWSANTEFDEFLRASIDPTWPGDMPRTLLISPSGQVKTIPGTAQMSEVERWLETVGR